MKIQLNLTLYQENELDVSLSKKERNYGTGHNILKKYRHLKTKDTMPLLEYSLFRIQSD